MDNEKAICRSVAYTLVCIQVFKASQLLAMSAGSCTATYKTRHFDYSVSLTDISLIMTQQFIELRRRKQRKLKGNYSYT